MGPYPPAVERVIGALTKLPSIGTKTAQRLVFHLLGRPADETAVLASALAELHEKVTPCSVCFHLAEDERCSICADPRRDTSLLCVVEQPTDVVALERARSYRGLYHVLGGALSPIKDVGPENLRIGELVVRIREGGFREVILATNPNVEGEATAVFLSRQIKPLGVPISRLAQGLPAGGDLEYTDLLTLQRALEGRRDY